MRLAQIAVVFGVTEARICQIHAQSIRTLREEVLAAMER
jgi:DNA-directed RNA polymerase specialized sigma subunit